MPIFLDDSARERFSKLLFVCNSKKPVVFKTIQGSPLDEIDRGETLVNIGAYCLMPNHFHLLLREKVENGITIFMGKLCTAYSMYFNKRNERTGRLFEGIFKATHAKNDFYLKYLYAYIHLNPVKMVEPNWKENGISDIEKVKEFLKKHKYSSYPDYIGEDRIEALILNQTAFPEYFETNKGFEYFVNEFVQGSPLEREDLL